MPQNSSDPRTTPGEAVLDGDDCPKCGAGMESVKIDVEGLPIQQLRLCPECYLVTWKDENGFHSRQGVPMKEGSSPTTGGYKLPEC